MKEFFLQLKKVSPADMLAAAEQGAEYIHNLPYRFVAWLPSAPGLLRKLARAAGAWFVRTETVQEVLAVHEWMERKADEIHELPYRFAAWLPTVPGLVEAWKQRRKAALARWAERYDVVPRLKLFLPLCAAGAIFALCVQDVEHTDLTYVLMQGNNPRIITGTPSFSQQLTGLEIVKDRSSADAQLILDAGQTVLVTHDGVTESVKTRRETVANLLRRMGIECGERMVVLDTSGSAPTISLMKELVTEHTVSYPYAYAVKRVADPLMWAGTEKITVEGQMGSINEVYQDIYENGRLSHSEIISREVLEPVDTVIKYGTRVKEVSRDDRIKKVVYNRDGSGYLLFKSGETMTFSQKVTCNATAYSIGKWTASGLPTKVGHIAVDPKVFPYHTRFYIYTDDGYLVYGNAVAADCGRAIKGYKIDLWFETFAEACNFGRRNCTVFVLN